jgi:hypothetical protein
LWKKARMEGVPVEQGESLLEDGGSDYEEGSQYAEGYASNHRELDGYVDEEESRNQPDYASNHREVDGDVEEESWNQPDTTSNHSEVVGDVGSQAAWDDALEEAVRLHNSTPRRVLEGHSEAPSSQSEEESQEMSVTKEGCIEVLDCTSMRRHPGGDHGQKESTSETSSVSRCI